VWVAIHTRLREQTRQVEGRKRHASAAIIDSQSGKNSAQAILKNAKLKNQFS